MLQGEPQLPADAKADVCIVGAGIAGLTTAYLLATGQSVSSSSTTARRWRRDVSHDGPSGHRARRPFYHLDELHGHEGARWRRKPCRRHRSDRAIVSEERIDCDFARLDGYLFVPPGDDSHARAGLGRAPRGTHGRSRVERAPSSFDTGRPSISRGKGSFTSSNI